LTTDREKLLVDSRRRFLETLAEYDTAKLSDASRQSFSALADWAYILSCLAFSFWLIALARSRLGL
jgi:hypothetical protein